MVKPDNVASRLWCMDDCRWDKYFTARVMKRMLCKIDPEASWQVLFGAVLLRVLLVWARCVRLSTAAVEFEHAPDSHYIRCKSYGPARAWLAFACQNLMRQFRQCGRNLRASRALASQVTRTAITDVTGPAHLHRSSNPLKGKGPVMLFRADMLKRDSLSGSLRGKKKALPAAKHIGNGFSRNGDCFQIE